MKHSILLLYHLCILWFPCNYKPVKAIHNFLTSSKDKEDISTGESSLSSIAADHRSEEGIVWLDLSVRTKRKTKHSKSVEYILHKSSGFIPNGHLCGIIGPSGSGKSTFLAALSGTTLKSTKLQVSGQVWMKNHQLNHKYKNQNINQGESSENKTSSSYLSTKEGEVAFLQQEDVFFSMLTPYETLTMAARLQLPANLEYSERQVVVQKLMDSLGLGNEQVQHRRVGDRTVGGEGYGGLSGGERRRLSVAVELITTPKLLLADEPTTGLDSSQAEKVMSLIAKVAKEKRIPSICTLHQPRASIWKKLDSFIRKCYPNILITMLTS